MFSNSEIPIHSLPKVENISFNAIEKRYLSVIYLNIVMTYSVLGLIVVFLKIFFDEIFALYNLSWILLAVILVSFIFSIFVYTLGITYRKYALRTYDILYKRGFLFQTTTVIPLNRIQHTEIKQSIIEKQLRLSSLVIYTAGDESIDLQINGLATETAEKLNAFLINAMSTDV